MITEEMLNAQAELAGLTPEQRNVILTLSRNDENTVIANKTRDIYSQMDETIRTATGVAREGSEKTYDYLKRATTAFTDKYKDYDSLKSQITTLTSEKAALEAKIAGGAGDEAIKAQLAQVKAELQTTKDQFNTLKADKDKAELQYNQTLLGIRVDAEVQKAKEGLKFKAGLSEQAIANLVGMVVGQIKGYNPKYEGEAGSEVIRYYDENGVIKNNPNNKLNPYTTKELLLEGLEKLDILDKTGGKGAGGAGNTPKGGGIINAATQVEAMAIIEKTLLAKGLVKGSNAYSVELSKMWDENEIDKLPAGY